MKRRKPAAIVCAAALVLLAGCGDVELVTPDTTPPAGLQPIGAPSATPGGFATAPFAPPPATDTPGPTPTPVVYIIQAGDTLGGIAAAYGVSVQALQAANGIDNPLLLQIGQRIIIPTGEEPVQAAGGLLLPTPTPLPFAVRGVGFYETPVGSLWCLGEVINTTTFSLTNMLVQVALYDAAGNYLVNGDAFVVADILPPSERAPFGILFISPPPGFASHQVTVLRGEVTGELSAGYVPLVAEGLEGVPSGPQFDVSGAVRNASATQSIGTGTVIVTTYDEEGRVTGFRQQELQVAGGLAAGASVPFRVVLTTHKDAPAEFSVIALGRVQ